MWYSQQNKQKWFVSRPLRFILWPVKLSFRDGNETLLFSLLWSHSLILWLLNKKYQKKYAGIKCDRKKYKYPILGQPIWISPPDEVNNLEIEFVARNTHGTQAWSAILMTSLSVLKVCTSNPNGNFKVILFTEINSAPAEYLITN